MSFQQPFAGYPRRIFATCYQSVAWLAAMASGGPVTPALIADPARVVFRTLRNGSEAVDAWRAGIALSTESVNLAAVAALPLSLDPTTQTYFNARIAGVAAAGSGIAALPPAADPFDAVALLSGGSPAIAYPGYLEWCMGFDGEAPPAALTAATLPQFAGNMTTAWLTVANAVMVLQGANPTSAYDTAARMYRCSAQASGIVAGIPDNPFTQGTFDLADYRTVAWNGTVALPTILLDANALSTPPSTLAAQQALTVRYVLNAMAAKLAVFLGTLQTTVKIPPATATLTNRDTLQDVAARKTGDFARWTEIAAINSLTPPYPGPTNQAVALSGRQLYMPGSGVRTGATGTPPSYPDSTMGVDWWFGPINGNQPAWNGDVLTIGGFANFAHALGRRIQTPIGALVYHQEYGSRIPGEVGAVQSVDEASRLAAFGRAALAADKRTGRIVSAAATVMPGTLASFSGVVQPIGPGSLPVDVAATIQPP